MYTYQATMQRIIDADTIQFVVDLGFHVRIAEKFRLANINAFERYTDKGKEAIKFVADWFAANPLIVLISQKPIRQEKYGRWLAIVHSTLIESADISLNDLLIAKGLAVPYMTE